jgi:hypothetical protein
VSVAGGRFAAGRLGELTRIVPFEMVDAVLVETRRVQARVRVLPSRVVVYLLLAAGLFTELGYSQVWARMIAGLDRAGSPMLVPSASALSQARRRLGPAPLKALFDLLRGPAAGPAMAGVWWRGLLVCALDGTQMCVPDSPANLTVYRRGGTYHGATGYPMLRLAALVCCGTRTLLDAVFASDRRSETSLTMDLLTAMRPGMIVLADRYFGYAPMITAVAATGAELLFRVRNNTRLPVLTPLADGSFLSRMGAGSSALPVRVVRVEITTTPHGGGPRAQRYTLVSTICDPTCPALELARLYHQRWEIETTFFELKATILGGRVLRARTPDGVAQEVYALLVTYQALRIAIADAVLAHPHLDPDRASFTIALNTARAQLTTADALTHEPATRLDLAGTIGRRVLAALLPPRRRRTGPRVVKRAISNYTVKTATGRARGPSRNYTIEINTIPPDSP